jgi:sugar lactone lactonase YvrE
MNPASSKPVLLGALPLTGAARGSFSMAFDRAEKALYYLDSDARVIWKAQ